MAARFKDAAGHDWLVPINVTTVRRVRGGTDPPLNLLAIIADKGKTLERLATDPEVLVDTLFLVCKEQCDREGVTPEQFAEGLIGDALDAASKALFDGIVAFFRPGQRRLLAAALAKLDKFQDVAEKTVLEHIESDALDERIRREISEALTDSTD